MFDQVWATVDAFNISKVLVLSQQERSIILFRAQEEYSHVKGIERRLKQKRFLHFSLERNLGLPIQLFAPDWVSDDQYKVVNRGQLSMFPHVVTDVDHLARMYEIRDLRMPPDSKMWVSFHAFHEYEEFILSEGL